MSAEDARQKAIGDFERNYHEIESKLLALSAGDLERPVWTGEGPGWRIRDLSHWGEGLVEGDYLFGRHAG